MEMTAIIENTATTDLKVNAPEISTNRSNTTNIAALPMVAKYVVEGIGDPS